MAYNFLLLWSNFVISKADFPFIKNRKIDEELCDNAFFMLEWHLTQFSRFPNVSRQFFSLHIYAHCFENEGTI
jgi:hypothetical protein